MTARSLKALAATYALTLLAAVCTSARDDAPRPKHAPLPRRFAEFKAEDVLGSVFEGYDPKTGRVATMLNGELKPTLVQLREARAWNALGREDLVVLVDVAGDDYNFVDFCGNCAMYALLAVLRREGRALKLVARQDVPASSVAGDDDPESDGPPPEDLYAPFLLNGHDTDVRLDLAPYCFGRRETLLGIRREHMWMPANDYSTSLSLYRVEGARLHEVFYDVVVWRDYPQGARKGRPVVKTTSTLSPYAGGREFNNLVIEKTTVRCTDADDDADCTPPREPARVVRKTFEVWSFDGKSFRRTNKKAPPASRVRATCNGR